MVRKDSGDAEVEEEAEVGAQTGDIPDQAQVQPLIALNGTSRDLLVSQTLNDKTLDNLRYLADRTAEGFAWENGLLFKHQLNQCEDSTRRLCVPLPNRKMCMIVAHDMFGHSGKNKIGKDLARLFYWPSLCKDISLQCRACIKGQQFNKAKPRHTPMMSERL